MARKLLALLLLVFATPAFATTYVGTVPGFDYVSVPIPFGPGKYQLSFAFSAPVAFDVTIHTELHYNYFDIATGEYLGGNDGYYDDTREYYTPTRSGSVQWTVNQPYTHVFGDIVEYGYYNGVGADFNFYGDPDTTVTYYLGITAVPEPGQWALLITGFGLAGTALRRRSRIRPGAMATA
ncbi:PEPxxWA-CTERM sorting domain-containing protein [uncultured Sphingomonas sp.]|uniref:PEPxxWA-CTERM sorting domain-containing protein n=1 Tax=uncultured Sphingomonas sp. TaxID=158754 RepID=UPI0025DAB255|nr:PEPxxWA-CTERM sorting domain-containing protein [uncultured Sphingomonas sp.]